MKNRRGGQPIVGRRQTGDLEALKTWERKRFVALLQGANASVGRILDLGCGKAPYLETILDAFRPTDLVLVDCCAESLAECGQRLEALQPKHPQLNPPLLYRVRAEAMRVEEVTNHVRGNLPDLVICSRLINYTLGRAIDDVIDRITEVLPSGGHLLISWFAAEGIPKLFPPICSEKGEFAKLLDADAYQRYFEKLGFTTLSKEKISWATSPHGRAAWEIFLHLFLFRKE